MIIRMIEKVLVAGAGITGALTASILRKELPIHCHLSVWDKDNGTGGRMSTSRSLADNSSTVDLGAQYISVEPPYFLKNKCIYDELLHKGILQPLTGTIEGDKPRPMGTQHYISPTGIGSVVEHFLEVSGAELKLNHSVEDICEEDGRFVVRTEHGVTEAFDCVILTMPVPQILTLQGMVPQAIDAIPRLREQLGAVQYSTRFAAGLFYDPGTVIDIQWAAKYFQGHPTIVFVALDNVKRGHQESGHIGPSVLVHTSVPFSLKHKDEDPDSVCTRYLLPALQDLLPQLPAHIALKNHKWTYSQVFKGYVGSPGVVKLWDSPLLLCGGDAFTNSGFDRCVESARAISESVIQAAKQAQL